MKISVLCMGRGSTVKNINNKEIIIYYVNFAVKREKNPHQQKFYGEVHLESPEPFHYKEQKEYTLMLSELINVPTIADMKRVGNVN